MERGGWEQSAEAWIASVGEEGDWTRKWVLDAPMLRLSEGFDRALDVGCGEGRFARKMSELGTRVTALDPVESLLAHAASRGGHIGYIRASGEQLPFRDCSFDLVVSYLTLIDIPDFRRAIREMSRVLEPGGRLLVANLSPFATTADGWVKDSEGTRLYFPIDRYLSEFSQWYQWRGIHIENYHRPLSAYMEAFLAAGLQLEHYLEPKPLDGAPDKESYERVPWAHVMAWRSPLRS